MRAILSIPSLKTLAHLSLYNCHKKVDMKTVSPTLRIA